jgi:hypothetical protein
MCTFNGHVSCDNGSFSCFNNRGIITDSYFDPAVSSAKYACQCRNYARLIEVHTA